MEKEIDWPAGGTRVRLRVSPRRRRIGIGVENGVVVLHAPPGGSPLLFRRVLDENRTLIERLLAADRRRPSLPPPEFRIGARFRVLGNDCPVVRRDEAAGGVGFDGTVFGVTSESPEVIAGQVLAAYRRTAAVVIGGKVRRLSEKFGIAIGRIRINAASGRWGSCSAAGNLNFSWKLLMCPEPVVDYVVAHELAHRRQMNHSPAFWAEVGRLCPNYRVWRKLIREEEIRFRAWKEW